MPLGLKTSLLLSLICSQLLLSACGVSRLVMQSDDLLEPEAVAVASDNSDDREKPLENPYLARAVYSEASVPEKALRQFGDSQRSIENKDWKTAEEQLQVLIRNYPELSGPCLSLALLYRHLKENDQADYWFRQTLARNKSNLFAYNQYGIFLRQQGHFRKAEQMYLSAISIWEPYPDTHKNIAILYDLYRGNQSKALEHYQRYQELSTDDDRQLAGWIVDLQRQLAAVERGVGNE